MENVIYAKDYQPPHFLIEKTDLTFILQDNVTQVHSKLRMLPNNDSQQSLVLNGQNLKLLEVKLNGQALSEAEYQLTDELLTIANPPSEAFTLECSTEIEPEKNLALEGLYRSRGMYCTQCEAEGFRRITYFLDRPDVLSEYQTTIIAPEGKFPVMLSNGNCLSDTVEAGLRKVTWHDPFKKPSYLFALVAGDLTPVEDQFTTLSGRQIKLQIFVEEKDLDKCEHAMNSLKAAMRWDEEVYGREYDLDIFMIVAVDDFNMGAMENKGLNIFNTSCVLANPKTTTDAGFQRVEAVVAHEYFHNWSGNRVTCRDWFQLSLKEGFTVYRDSEFSADQNSRVVKRIEDATLMRQSQFVEDSGPISHPIRPESFVEISNFYTLTVYEKGAEVVRMLANLLGKETFRTATDLYFDRFDGQAVTCEDFVQCMEEAGKIDLTQFRYWYSQAGTPEVHIDTHYDENAQQFQLTFEQKIPDTAGQKDKQPMVIPIDMALIDNKGLIDIDGKPAKTITLTDKTTTITFDGITTKPTPSFLRNFSAPIKYHVEYTDADLALIIQKETDGFSQFDAMQQLSIRAIQQSLKGETLDASALIESLTALINNSTIDPAMMAKMLVLPAESYLIELSTQPDPLDVYQQRKALQIQIAKSLENLLLETYEKHADAKGLSGNAMAARALKNQALYLCLLANPEAYRQLAHKQFNQACNMTDESAALMAMTHLDSDHTQTQQALQDFYQRYQDESLVVNSWLQIQSTAPRAETLKHIQQLQSHPAYDPNNPNKIRALIGGFCSNTQAFHQTTGLGYQFLAEEIFRIDQINPQIASRLVAPLTRYKKLAANPAEKMQKQIEWLSMQTLSKDLTEVITKSLT
ncbi:MAG: aminopeptidase N [Cellvibrionales bacterium]|nr:aminopeptidase N [Cellvibrionales bacterium]